MRTAMLAAILAALASTGESEERLSLSDGKWDLKGEGTAVENVDGREALRMETGLAYRRDVRLQDGVIEFDVQVTRRRSFVYVAFRMADEQEHEEIYFRPHKSGLPDAVQYAPVYQGQSAWQLFHGPGATAAVAFEPGAWTHVKLVLQGRRGALFFGQGARPALLARLDREPREGSIALSAFVPPGSGGAPPSARFANVVVRPGVVDFDFASAPAETSAPGQGAVRAWAVSRAFAAKQTPRPEVPGAGVTGEFQRVEAGPSGLVELHRHVRLPEGARAASAAARVQVRATQAGPRRFDLGFSDTALVFLNGRPLFQGEASYSFDAPRREGLIGYDQATLFLPLLAGDNELVVVVSDRFGGWGLMGRFGDPTGITLDAR